MPRKKKTRKRPPPKRRKPRKSARKKKFSLFKPLKSWFNKRTRTFRKNKIKWFLFLGALVIVWSFFFFQDYRSDSQQFESSVRASVKNIQGAKLIEKKSVAKENWRAKWNEIRLVVLADRKTGMQKVWKRIKDKIPEQFTLYREVVTETGSSHLVSAEYRRRNIPIGFIRVEERKKSVSTEFLSKEKEVVKPKRFFSISKIVKKVKPKPKKKAPVVVKKKPRPKTPRVAIVIDDVGNSQTLYSTLFSLPAPLTVAILPRLTFSKQAAQMAKQKGFESILHQPVESVHHNDTLGPGGIFIGHSKAEISSIVSKNLDSLPYITGSNHHQGSRGSQDLRLMKAYLKPLKKRNMFYLDSWTARNTKGREAAASVGVPYLKRAVFLDNVDSKPAIRKQVEELMTVAKQKGSAIGIGHIKKNTLVVLGEMIPKMKRRGIKVVKLEDLV